MFSGALLVCPGTDATIRSISISPAPKKSALTGCQRTAPSRSMRSGPAFWSQSAAKICTLHNETLPQPSLSWSSHKGYRHACRTAMVEAAPTVTRLVRCTEFPPLTLRRICILFLSLLCPPSSSSLCFPVETRFFRMQTAAAGHEDKDTWTEGVLMHKRARQGRSVAPRAIYRHAETGDRPI